MNIYSSEEWIQLSRKSLIQIVSEHVSYSNMHIWQTHIHYFQLLSLSACPFYPLYCSWNYEITWQGRLCTKGWKKTCQSEQVSTACTENWATAYTYSSACNCHILSVQKFNFRPGSHGMHRTSVTAAIQPLSSLRCELINFVRTVCITWGSIIMAPYMSYTLYFISKHRAKKWNFLSLL